MIYAQRCPSCGREMPERSPQGLCPACLLGWVIHDRLDPGNRVRYFGDYEVLGVLGSGAMGVVYEARQVSLNRTVALKMIRAGAFAGDDELRRFQNEAEAIARLDHPHIVPIYEVGEHEGKRYFSMKLIAGPCLSNALTSYTTDPQAAARLLITIVEAVQHAHERGILHRDLKPSNILLDEKGQPHVTDFGLAKQLEGEDGLTKTGAVLGTPAYMAPEQATGRNNLVTTSSDVYGLGAILYTVLTGKPPFDGDSTLQTLDMVRLEQPRAPSRINRKVPRDLEIVCLKCLEKEPERRYPSAHALAADLRRFLSGRPIKARRASFLEKSWRWCRRQPSIAVLSAALVITIASGLLGFTLLWLQAIAAREEAMVRERDWLKASKKGRELTKSDGERLKSALDLRGKEQYAAAIDRAANVKMPALVAKANEPADLAERRQYNDRMNLIERYWESGRRELMQHALAEETPAKPGAIDRRGFEWFYWQRKILLPPDRTLRGHTAAVDSVAFSPNGKQIASAGFDGTVRIWDIRTGRTIQTLEGHIRRVESVAFSPDGTRIASASADQTLKVWDAASGTDLITLQGHIGELTSVAFSPDGRSLASASRDRTVKLWDIAKVQPTLTLRGHTDEVTSVAFSPDGKRIVSASRDETVRLWDLPSGRETRAFTGHSDWVLCAAFSPDGKRIASADSDGSVKVWDSQSGKQTLNLALRRGSVKSVIFSPDGTRIAAGASSVTVWDIATGKLTRTLPEGTPVASYSSSSNKWDETERKLTLDPEKDSNGADDVAFSPDGGRIACASWDGTVKLWRATNGRETLSWKACEYPITSMAFSPDGHALATVSRENTVKVWDSETGMEFYTLNGHTDWVSSVAFSPDGTRLASGSDDQTVKIWDAETGKETRTLKGHTSPVTEVVFSPDSRRLASASWEKTAKVWIVKVWDTQTTQELFTFKRHTAEVQWRVFLPNGKQLASVGGGETDKVQDAATGQEIRMIDFHFHAETLAFNADNTRIPFASGVETFILLKDTKCNEASRTLRGHTDTVVSVAFSPDGTRLASGSNDRTVKLWDTATGQETLTLKGLASPATLLLFSPDGRRLASASSEKNVKVWDARPIDARPSTPEPRLISIEPHGDPFYYVPK